MIRIMTLFDLVPGKCLRFGSVRDRCRQAYEIPQVAVEIIEHGDRAVRLDLWFADELDSALSHSIVVAPEIVRGEKQEDPAASLIPDCTFLLRCGRFPQ